MKKTKHILAALLACSLGLTSCDFIDNLFGKNETEEVAQVDSISISGAKSEIAVGESVSLSAKITVTGDASKSVTWSTSDSSIATVSNKGKVTGKAVGTVVITATAKADTSKTASVTINVVKPHWSTNAVALMNEVLGVEVPYLGNEFSEITKEIDEEGTYLFATATTFNGDAYKEALEADGYTVTLDDYMFYTELLASKLVGDSTLVKISIFDYSVLGTLFDDEEDPVELTMYALEGSNSWPTEAITGLLTYMDFEQETLPVINDGVFFIEAADEEGAYFSVFNSTTTGAQYIETLRNEGFEIDDSETALELYGGPLFTSPNGTLKGTVVSIGNEIQIVVIPVNPVLDAYPSKYVNEFITNFDTIFSLPEIVGANATYQYYEVEEGDENEAYASVYASGLTLDEVNAYLASLTSAGYDLLEEDGELMAQLGKIAIEGSYGVLTNDEDSLYGIVIYISCANGVDENPLILSIDESVIPVEGQTKVNYVVASGFDGTVTFSSSNDSVATVDNEGNVTAISAGTANIVATLETSSNTFTNKVSVTVKNVASEIFISGNNEVTGGDSLKFSVAPLNSEDLLPEGTPTWSVNENSCATIDDNGVLTTTSVTEETTVVVTVNYAGLEATLEVTVKTKPLAEKIIFTSMFANKSNGTSITSFESPINGIEFEASIGANSNSGPVYYDTDGLRLYTQNQLKVSAPEGHTLTTIQFEINNGDKKVCQISANAGTWNQSTLTWTGNETTVTFDMGTVSKSQFRITNVTVCLDGSDIGSAVIGGGSTEEGLDSFPLSQVEECLDIDFDFPIPTGTSFTFEEDDYYYYDCYVEVFGGDMNAYLSALEGAGFAVDDSYLEDDDCYYCTYAAETLEIDVYPGEDNTNYLLDIYIYDDEE